MDAQERWYRRNMDLRGQVVADVGANVGRLSQFFWDQGDERTRVVSIEPLPQNLERLRERVSAAQSDRWRIEACAVSATDGTVFIEPSHSNEHGWNSAVRPTKATGTIEVPSRRLSTIVPEATIVKVDIEGHEYAVLDEALGAMHDVQCWAVELHMMAGHPLQATLRAFAEQGYTVYAAAQRPDDPSGAWHNVAVPDSLGWDRIPVAERRPDGSIFKMLHIVAKRAATPEG